MLAHPDGTLTWISPAGQSQTTGPCDYRRFVDELPAGDPEPAEPVVTLDRKPEDRLRAPGRDVDEPDGDQPPF